MMAQVNILSFLSITTANDSTLSGNSVTNAKNTTSVESSKQSFDKILSKVSSKREFNRKNSNVVEKKAAEPKEYTENSVSNNQRVDKNKNTDEAKFKDNVADVKDKQVKDFGENEKPLDETEEKTAAKTAAILAQALGISTDDALKMLQSLNLEGLNLSGSEDQSKLVDAIAEFAGLNQLQKDVLSAVIKDTAEQFASVIQEPLQNTITESPTDKNSSIEELTDTNFLQDESNLKANESVDTNADDLLNDITQKVKEAVNNLPQDSVQKVVKENLKNESLQNRADSKIAVIENNTGETENTDAEVLQTSDVTVGGFDDLNEASDSAPSDDRNDTQQENTNGKTNDAINVLVREDAGYMNNIERLSFQDSIDQAISNIKASTAATETVNITAKDIIEQVISSSKVILSDDKSEMVMNLKPDSLGKLMLKIVTEKGMVMAKFTVENNQVKEVLESNMQLLKDSLEKQGLNVEYINVSVGHDNSRESQQAWEKHNTIKYREQSKNVLGSISVSANYERFSDNSMPDLYLLDGSTLNLMA